MIMLADPGELATRLAVAALGPDFRRSQAHEYLIECVLAAQEDGEVFGLRNPVGTRD
jgi:hypothetical protein